MLWFAVNLILIMDQEIILGNITVDLLSFAIGAGVLCFFAVIFWFMRSARLKANNQHLENQLNDQDEVIEKLEAESKSLEQKLMHVSNDLVRAQTEKESFSRQITQNREDLEKMEKKFQLHFENLANKIFDEKTNKFKAQSQEGLNELLNPLRDKLNDFHKKVDDSFGNQAKEQFALKEQIKMIVDTNEKMTLQAESLASALKGDSKTQGDWGEIVLEKLLEDSGLKKGVNYTPQGTGLGIKDAQTGRTQKPDIVVNLPDNKHIIIDSKVSLTHYERYHSEPDEAAKSVQARIC